MVRRECWWVVYIAPLLGILWKTLGASTLTLAICSHLFMNLAIKLIFLFGEKLGKGLEVAPLDACDCQNKTEKEQNEGILLQAFFFILLLFLANIQVLHFVLLRLAKL